MIKIHRLVRPNKHSGHPLEPGKSTTVKEITITNTSSKTVYVDRFTRKPWKPKKLKKK